MNQHSSYARRLPLFPKGTHLVKSTQGYELAIHSQSLALLVEQYGTPLYVYHRPTLDMAVKDYQDALANHYPGPSGLTYAGKAFLCLAIAQWALTHDLWLDCSSAGELAIARAAGAGRDRILVHGVSKSAADLQAALNQAGVLVVDNLDELDRLSKFGASTKGALPDLWLRLRPGHGAGEHNFTQTGHTASKFGLSPDEVFHAVRVCQETGLPLTGLHFHLGSNIRDPVPLGLGLDTTLKLAAKLRLELGWTPRVICPGGGWGVAYHEEDLPHPEVAGYIHHIAAHILAGCQKYQLPIPHLQLEPGRSLIARSGIALYQVQATKSSDGRRWLLLDGGLADNPRPALYQARYSALPVKHPERPNASPTWLGGPYCESGDVLIAELPLPDIQPGEYIAIPVSGAYQLSMSSNYNGACRPAVIWLEEGGITLIQRRETPSELLRRDYPLAINRS